MLNHVKYFVFYPCIGFVQKFISSSVKKTLKLNENLLSSSFVVVWNQVY